MCSDGDLMEGISFEAASIAGHLGLGNLICLYDSNRITIEGSTDLAFTEDISGRFTASGWHVQKVCGHDHAAISNAISAAVAVIDKPSMIICETVIGRGAATMEGSNETHGAPLGQTEVQATKAAMGWPQEPKFLIPEDVKAFFHSVGADGTRLSNDWENCFQQWRTANPEKASLWDACYDDAPIDAATIDRILAAAMTAEGKASRVMFGSALQEAFKSVPNLIGGSADLGPSNNTVIKNGGNVGRASFEGANLHFGIREHAMAAITNGIVLHGAFRPFCATFLIFSDYLKPAARMASLMRIPSTFVFSHDSFRVGEDGPTHQPIEQLSMLRAIPDFTVLRPADPVEMAGCWSFILDRRRGPVAIATTRQNIPKFARPGDIGPDCVKKGGYIFREAPGGKPDLVIAASGSELQICFEAIAAIEATGRKVRLVSMPSMDLFKRQSPEYRREVLGEGVPLVGVEAGATDTWAPLLAGRGFAIGIDHFGQSAPAEVLAVKYGFTPETVAARIITELGLQGLQ
jgi:transketolase